MDFGEYNIKIEDETLRKLAIISNGDVRTALNGLEVAVLTTNMEEDGYIYSYYRWSNKIHRCKKRRLIIIARCNKRQIKIRGLYLKKGKV